MRYHRLAAGGISALLALASGLLAPGARAQSDEDLAKELANPVAALISLPFQANYDADIGPADDGSRFYINVQPVVPFGMNADWNLISRTILPLIDQREIFPGAGDQTGAGDLIQSLFFSPKKPTKAGVIWGVGPALVLPIATDELLGTEKWSIGPTAVILRQQGPWTYGALGNHLWSVAGDDDRADVSSTFIQPFLSYTTRTAWTLSVNTESTYDWEASRWTVPINGNVSKLVKFGKQPVSLGGGLRYWAKSPDGAPEGFGLRFTATLLFPKKG